MSCLAAVIDFRSTAPVAPTVHRMLAAGAHRGAGASDVWSATGRSAALGLARFEWELAEGLSGGAEVVRDGDVCVAADATLYYVGELRDRLSAAGVRPAGATPSHLIAAAYRAWGDDCVSRLEGDYAFIVWDARQRSLFVARDFVGTRALYFAMAGTALVLGSTVGAVLAHPGVDARPNVAMLAEAASGVLTNARDTGYEAVAVMPAGHVLRFTGATLVPTVALTWQPPTFAGEARSRVSFADAAMELRALLEGAVRERMLPSGPTAITLSGGWDSSAIYAAGQSYLERAGANGQRLAPVSMSFPEGNSGREDEMITDVLGRWNATTRWMPIADAPLLDRLRERAAGRDDLFGHGFEPTNRMLARGSVETGARAVLNGYGGDQWFQAEPLYLADYVRRGRLLATWREWRALGGTSARELVPWGIVPLLGGGARSAIGRLRGRPVRMVLDPVLAPWIRPDFVRTHAVADRMKAATPARRAVRTSAEYEKYWYLVHPYFPRVAAETSGLSVEEGIEQRAPLMDERVVRFAAARPRSDRRQGNETKRLLRAAVSGLLPDAFLAPRPYRTGTMTDYFGAAIREGAAELGREIGKHSALADLGVIDLATYHSALADCARGDLAQATMVYATMQAEFWLRDRVGVDVRQSRRSSTGA